MNSATEGGVGILILSATLFCGGEVLSWPDETRLERNGSGGSQPISDFFDKEGRGVSQFLISSDKVGGGFGYFFFTMAPTLVGPWSCGHPVAT